MVKSYKELIVWQKSMDLLEYIYVITSQFPKSDLYGLTSQMNRCAVSIPSNIAESSRRRTYKDKQKFLTIAYSSGSELETQLEIVKRLRYGSDDHQAKAMKLLNEVLRMLNKMVNYSYTTNY